MREIKFRAWDKKTETMYQVRVIDNTSERPYGLGYKENPYLGIKYRTQDTIELIQYTGLKDKNGKEIYEGDILRYKQKPEHKKTAIDYTSYVVYKGNCFRLEPCLIRWNDLSLGLMSHHMEVIGNIYKDESLLNK